MWSIKRLNASAALTALVLVAGCAAPRPAPMALAAPATPLDQFQITTHERPDQVGLTVHPEGVTPAQRDALAALVARWRDAGGGLVTVQAPNDAADATGAHAFADAAVSTLGVLGVPYEQIRVIGYAGGRQGRPVVLASFNTVIADVPNCGAIPWDNLTATRNNNVSNHFGCEVTANLAAQIAYPADIAGQVQTGPSDAARRAVVLGKYRAGAITASEKDEQASGSVSQKVK